MSANYSNYLHTHANPAALLILAKCHFCPLHLKHNPSFILIENSTEWMDFSQAILKYLINIVHGHCGGVFAGQLIDA